MSSIDAAAPATLTETTTGPQSTESRVPMVSIIVPTYNRARTLPFLFDALGRQIYPASRIELIVVDNSSADDTELTSFYTHCFLERVLRDEEPLCHFGA